LDKPFSASVIRGGLVPVKGGRGHVDADFKLRDADLFFHFADPT